jgi:MoaA/NifB/PqqE/SkfB family radical SAM enzyme
MIKNFKCSAPWEGMFINPDGDFRVCCSGQSLGNLNKNTLTEIINGKELSTVRNSILTKGYSDYCINCMESEKKSGKSLRDQFNTDLSKSDTSKFIPKILDIRWRNTCQLRCGYCNSEWSSAYARWEGKLDRVSEKDWQRDVLDFIKNNNSEIHTVHLLGGEPLLLKENLELLDYIDKSIHVGIVTNLSPIDIDSYSVYQNLKNRNTSWLISLEATGNKFEYIRRNAKWSVSKFNYENLKVSEGSSKGCHMTYCILSAFSLVEVFDWLYELDSDPKTNTSFISLLLGPTQFAIHSFPPKIKLLAIRELDRLSEKYDTFLNQQTKNFIINTRQSLLDCLHEYDINAINRFKLYIEKSDTEMSPIKFRDEWPEVYEMLMQV